MGRPIAVLAVIVGALLAPVGLFGDDHLAPPPAAAARLAASAAQRERDLAVVRTILAQPQAGPVVSALGERVDRLQAAASGLSDRELRDLTARAAALGLDPAGRSHERRRRPRPDRRLAGGRHRRRDPGRRGLAQRTETTRARSRRPGRGHGNPIPVG